VSSPIPVEHAMSRFFISPKRATLTRGPGEGTRGGYAGPKNRFLERLFHHFFPGARGMRLLAVPFLSLALIWAVVLWDASRREEAHLASGLADARGAMAFLWSKVDGVLDDAMGVLGAPGAVETLGATQGAATEGDRLPALDAPRARLFAANLGAMGVIVSLLDDRGRLLWREPNLGGLDMGTADQSLGVRLVLSEQLRWPASPGPRGAGGGRGQGCSDERRRRTSSRRSYPPVRRLPRSPHAGPGWPRPDGRADGSGFGERLGPGSGPAEPDGSEAGGGGG
jgi:hypothetical protein